MMRQTWKTAGLLMLSCTTLILAGCAAPADQNSSNAVSSEGSVVSTVSSTLSSMPAATSPGTATSTVADVYNGVSQTALQACIDAGKADCTNSVPGLQQCLDTYKFCNRAVDEQLAKARQSQIDAADGVQLTSDTASKIAIDLSTDPTQAKVISIKQELFSDLPTAGTETISGLQAPNDVVFVVDIAGPNITDGGPALAEKKVDEYGAVIDAKSHQVIETCIGGPCTS
jgi:hypothetical protein